MDEPRLAVPGNVVGGVFANHVDVFLDPEHGTIDFARLDPRGDGEGVIVARVAMPTSCILVLKHQLEHVR